MANQSEPRVSVVMSVFNGEQYVRDAVESILAQEGVDFEFVAINDGSTDSTAAILDGFAKRDPRLKVLHQGNAGLTQALITGCDLARGKYIARQDSDDRSLPGRLFHLMHILENHPTAGIAGSSVRSIGPAGEVLSERIMNVDPRVATARVLAGEEGPPCHGSTMFRSELYGRVGGYRLPFYYGQDTDLWMRICEHGELIYTPQVLYEYRIVPTSISSVWRPVQVCFGELSLRCRLDRRAGLSEASGLADASALRASAIQARRHRSPRDARSASALGNYFIGSSLARRGDWRALAYFGRSVSAKLLWLKGWVRLLLAPPEILYRRTLAKVKGA